MDDPTNVESTDITDQLLREYFVYIRSQSQSMKAKAEKASKAFSEHRASLIAGETSVGQALSRDYLTQAGDLLELLLFEIVGGPIRIDEGAMTELQRLRVALSYLARGEKYALVHDAIGEGDFREEPLVTSAKAIAVAYVRAARDHRISDRYPNRTIQDVFLVRRKTVQEWCRDEDLRSLAAAKYADDISGIVEELKAAGALYHEQTKSKKTRRYEEQRI